MGLPSAIIFINSDEPRITVDGYFQDGYQVPSDGYINAITKQILETQLYIHETMTFSEFNSRVTADPNYADVVHLQNLRILVILPTFQDYTNRDKADLVLFYSHGNVTVEVNKYGPPGLCLPVQRINIYTLLREVGSSSVVIIPPPTS